MRRYTEAVDRAGPGARDCIDTMLVQHELDAIIAPTMGPAWPIDLVKGDKTGRGEILTGLAALSGYPHVTIPMGKTIGLPLGLSFLGAQNSEAKLLGLAYAFEQVADYVGLTHL